MLDNSHLKDAFATIWRPTTAVARPYDAVELVDPPCNPYVDHPFSPMLTDRGCGAMHAGYVPDPENFSCEMKADKSPDLWVWAHPIKYAGSDQYILPDSAQGGISFAHRTIQAIATDQHARSPYATDKHAVLFLVRKSIEAGQSLIGAKWHIDSTHASGLVKHFNRMSDFSPVTTEVPVQTYITSDHVPSTVQMRPTERIEIFHENGCVTDSPLRVPGLVRDLERYEIGLINQYVWHRGNVATEPGVRTFLAVMYIPTETVLDALCEDICHKGGAGALGRLGLDFD